ncbi:Bug family tripartite tricarboxylate transporter substrate binding protein [Pollutimonas bauzanensis]|uniref:Tripartite-type tricarboxylate transporter, receptor component TctC n=1 Tax=Pollutimonas bauzanensis TaxID=658167 RepID=A0A1M5X4U7_9BURK|nr:tripartite tricarboxylate transporter substrate binding protein [Pollutimonas bauzanensis]SHH94900.1 Tripartite-type tricarboxylate transporter, receptor component TctC [Pollutimonas bauzanensis]
MDRRQFCISMASVLPALCPGYARAAKLGDQPIVLVVPFSPGGNLDMVARVVSPALSEILGVSVVVENKPGAGGVIGAGYVSRSTPDGHTLLVTTPNAITVAPLMTTAAYSLANFAAVGQIAWASLVVVVHPESRFQTIEALLDEARRNPGTVAIGHAGLGTTNNIAMLSLEGAAQCRFTAVPYKGSAPALTDLMGRQTDAVIDQLTSSLSFIKSGKLKALAVLTAQRDPLLPQVPTIAEAGLSGFSAQTETGLLAPAGTPKAIIEQLNAALLQALDRQKLRDLLQTAGCTAAPSSPGDFQRLLEEQNRKARDLHAEGKLTAG